MFFFLSVGRVDEGQDPPGGCRVARAEQLEGPAEGLLLPDRDACPFHHADQLAGDGGCGIDDLHGGTGDPADDAGQEGIVGAAQDDAVGAGIQQRLQAPPDDGFGLRPVQDAVLDEFDETLADVFHNGDVVLEAAFRVQVFRSLEGAGRSQDADHAGARAERRGFHSRFHADERDGISRAQGGDGGRRGRVAGNDDGLCALLQQGLRDPAAPLLDVGRVLLSVRAVGVVREIDESLVRKQFPDLAVDGESAGPRVEDSNHRLDYYNCQRYETFRRLASFFQKNRRLSPAAP